MSAYFIEIAQTHQFEQTFVRFVTELLNEALRVVNQFGHVRISNLFLLATPMLSLEEK